MLGASYRIDDECEQSRWVEHGKEGGLQKVSITYHVSQGESVTWQGVACGVVCCTCSRGNDEGDYIPIRDDEGDHT